LPEAVRPATGGMPTPKEAGAKREKYRWYSEMSGKFCMNEAGCGARVVAAV